MIYLDADVRRHGRSRAAVGRAPARPAGARGARRRSADGLVAARPRSTIASSDSRPSLAYFNAGVMTLDLALWREEQLASQLLRYLERHAHAIRWWDQDALNAVLAGRWGELDPRWNQIPQFWEPAAGDTDPFPPALRELVIRDPWIVHYSTGSKPWHWGCRIPRASASSRSSTAPPGRAGDRAVPSGTASCGGNGAASAGASRACGPRATRSVEPLRNRYALRAQPVEGSVPSCMHPPTTIPSRRASSSCGGCCAARASLRA